MSRSPGDHTGDDWRSVAAAYEHQLAEILSAIGAETVEDAITKHRRIRNFMNRSNARLKRRNEQLRRAQARIAGLSSKPPARGRNWPRNRRGLPVGGPAHITRPERPEKQESQ